MKIAQSKKTVDYLEQNFCKPFKIWYFEY